MEKVKIKEWIEINKENISYKLYIELKSISFIYNFMDELSVIKCYKRLGVKSIIQLIEIYPTLTNEIGFICYDSIKYYKQNKKETL